MAPSSRILAGALIAVALALPAFGATFTDLPEGTSRSALATLLSEHGILPGISESEFGGQEAITRYELATLLNSLLDRRDVPFNVVAWSDIPPGHPAMPAVSRVTSMGLMNGSGGRFDGLRRVTRAEFVEAFVNLLSFRSVSSPGRRKGPPLTFSDVPSATETGKMLDRAANFWQVVEAPTRARFRPFEPVTRFEALDVLARGVMLLDPTLQEPIKEALKLGAPLVVPTPTPQPERTAAPRWTPAPERSEAPRWTPRPEVSSRPEASPRPLTTSRPYTPEPSPTPDAPSASPTPRRPFWASDAPSAAPTPTPERATPTPQPTARPETGARGHLAPLLVNRARVGPDFVLLYREGVPSDATLATATDKSDLQAVFPGLVNLDANGQVWLEGMGGTGGLSMIAPIAVSLSDGTATTLFDLTAHGEGLFKLPVRGPDWEAAVGAGVVARLINGGGTTYITTTKTVLGLGPVAQLAARVMPGLQFNGAIQLYPLEVQMYSLATGGVSAARLGGAWQLGADYELLKVNGVSVFGSLYYNGTLGLMLDGSALQTVHALNVGAGGRF